MRLIDVDVFTAELKERHENIMQDPEVSKRMKWCEAVHYGATTAIIEKMPTVEATPVVHGRWIERARVKGQVYCSECGTIEKETDSNYKSRLCPNCGSDMRGEKHGEK